MISWIRRLLLAVLFLVATSAAADDAKYFDEMQVRVKHAVEARDFDGLEAMAASYRKNSPHTPSGVAYLSMFYRMVFWTIGTLDPPHTPEGSNARHFVDSWLLQQPRGIAANIVSVGHLVGRAGDLRGGGYANTVPADALPKIQSLIALAKQRLFQARAFAAVDPQWYAEAVDVALLDEQSPGWVEPIFQEGAAHFPVYMPLYRSMIQYWLPQWYGSYKTIDTMAKRAALANTPEADGLYARIYRMLDESCGCSKPLREKTKIDWTLMKHSMRAVVARYPDSWNFSTFARISCEAGDIVEAQFFIARMKHPVDPYFTVSTNGETSCPANSKAPQT